MRRIASCITQLKAQGPSRTCNESKEEENVGGEPGCVFSIVDISTRHLLQLDNFFRAIACRGRREVGLKAARHGGGMCHGGDRRFFLPTSPPHSTRWVEWSVLPVMVAAPTARRPRALGGERAAQSTDVGWCGRQEHGGGWTPVKAKIHPRQQRNACESASRAATPPPEAEAALRSAWEALVQLRNAALKTLWMAPGAGAYRGLPWHFVLKFDFFIIFKSSLPLPLPLPLMRLLSVSKSTHFKTGVDKCLLLLVIFDGRFMISHWKLELFLQKLG